MSLLIEVTEILNQVLMLPQNRPALTENTLLMGAMPEFDSMAVVNIINKLEEKYAFVIADDEIEAAVFASVGTLLNFIEDKLSAIQ